jgi:uncharacterized protein
MLVIGMAVGLLVGLTGVGSGSLLTPMLILFSGMSPASAVGTSLWFSFLTKFYGAWSFHRRGLVNMDVVRDLSWGSLPGALFGAFLVRYLGVRRPQTMNTLLLHAIGLALIVVALLIIIRTLPNRFRTHMDRPLLVNVWQRRGLVLIIGFGVGISMALTSIGSGAALIPAIVLFHRLEPGAVVGSSMFLGALLALIAGVPHAGLGDVSWHDMAGLLCGSLPMIWLSSRLHGWVPRRLAESIVAGALAIMGLHIMAF